MLTTTFRSRRRRAERATRRCVFERLEGRRLMVGDVNVALEINDSVDPVQPGETFAYTVEVTNLQGVHVVNDDVQVVLDPDLEFVGADAGGTHANGTIRWPNLPIGANATVVLSATVRVKNTAAIGDTMRTVGFVVGEIGSIELETTRVAVNDAEFGIIGLSGGRAESMFTQGYLAPYRRGNRWEITDPLITPSPEALARVFADLDDIDWVDDFGDSADLEGLRLPESLVGSTLYRN